MKQLLNLGTSFIFILTIACTPSSGPLEHIRFCEGQKQSQLQEVEDNYYLQAQNCLNNTSNPIVCINFAVQQYGVAYSTALDTYNCCITSCSNSV